MTFEFLSISKLDLQGKGGVAPGLRRCFSTMRGIAFWAGKFYKNGWCWQCLAWIAIHNVLLNGLVRQNSLFTSFPCFWVAITKKLTQFSGNKVWETRDVIKKWLIINKTNTSTGSNEPSVPIWLIYAGNAIETPRGQFCHHQETNPVFRKQDMRNKMCHQDMIDDWMGSTTILCHWA